MLENRELWLESWSAAAERPRRCVRDCDSRNLLGQARLQPRPTAAWRRWLSRPSLEVVETEDESLLFTLHRLWGWGAAWWEVRDAEGRSVGVVSGGEVRDPLGRLVARVEAAAPGFHGRMLAPDGPELATVTMTADGWRISFADLVDDNPFAKMLFLAVLLLEPLP